MAKILAMFPGQGSQYVGMGKQLVADHKTAEKVFEEAEATLGIPIRSLCFDGDEATLTLTFNAQPCLLTVSYATWLVLQEKTGLKPDYFAGHSLGEYSALVASGKLAFSDALKLVRHRGEAMQRAVAPDVGAMAALLRFESVESIQAACENVSAHGPYWVQIANYNSPKQIVVAGHKEGVDALIEKLKQSGEKVVAKKLNVSAPFHCKLMAPAAEAMTPLLKATTFHQTPTQLLANLTGDVVPSYKPELLVDQITQSVRWTQTLNHARAYGVDTFIEIGPKKVLCGLAEATLTDPGLTIFSAEDVSPAVEQLKALK